MSIRLSAKGVSELKPVNEADLAPFDLAVDECSLGPMDDVSALPLLGGSRLAILGDFAKGMAALFTRLERSLSGAVAAPDKLQPAKAYPPDLLSRPWENLLIADPRLSFPAGCVKVLNEAGVVSLSMLKSLITAGELTRLPKVGKAKAAVITEVFEAFARAVNAAQSESERDAE